MIPMYLYTCVVLYLCHLLKDNPTLGKDSKKINGKMALFCAVFVRSLGPSQSL